MYSPTVEIHYKCVHFLKMCLNVLNRDSPFMFSHIINFDFIKLCCAALCCIIFYWIKLYHLHNQ